MAKLSTLAILRTKRALKNWVMLLASFEKHPLRHYFPPFAGFRVVESSSYYGKGYQDVEHRKPSIRNARRCWTGNRN